MYLRGCLRCNSAGVGVVITRNPYGLQGIQQDVRAVGRCICSLVSKSSTAEAMNALAHGDFYLPLLLESRFLAPAVDKNLHVQARSCCWCSSDMVEL